MCTHHPKDAIKPRTLIILSFSYIIIVSFHTVIYVESKVHVFACNRVCTQACYVGLFDAQWLSNHLEDVPCELLSLVSSDLAVTNE